MVFLPIENLNADRNKILAAASSYGIFIRSKTTLFPPGKIVFETNACEILKRIQAATDVLFIDKRLWYNKKY
jgi:hypothetical protein